MLKNELKGKSGGEIFQSVELPEFTGMGSAISLTERLPLSVRPWDGPHFNSINGLRPKVHGASTAVSKDAECTRVKLRTVTLSVTLEPRPPLRIGRTF
jgi:hypothetical protein